jgi:predicted nucleic acid-binding protein
MMAFPLEALSLESSDSGLKLVLRRAHSRNAAKPIVCPDENGVFPDAPIEGVPPIVVDANELFRDVAYAVRKARRTALISLANAGYVRLFCAAHVLAEVAEHAERVAARLKAPLAEFMACWTAEYLPLLRLAEIPGDLLTDAETERIERLELLDADDVPSARLALILGAYYFTKDRDAREAVYGGTVDHDVHDDVLAVIRARGDEVALEPMATALTAIPVGIGYGAFKGVEWVWKRLSPWAVLVGAAGAVFAWRSASPQRRERLKASAGAFL